MVLVLALGLNAATAHGAPPLQAHEPQSHTMHPPVSQEALQRKATSERVLTAEGVPINRFLPVMETESEARRRRTEEVAYRALALLVVAVKGAGAGQPVVESIVRNYGLASHFSPQERAFIRDAHPSSHDREQFVWRFEAAWTLLWALGYVEALEKPVAACDASRAMSFMQSRTTAQFLADARPRSLSELLDQADRIYRYDWAVVDARLKGREPPAGLDSDVTLERHHALNWLIGYQGQDWDDVGTDT